MNRKLLLLDSLKKYYDENTNSYKSILSILNGDSFISLRLLDWFVTNFSKKYKIVYDINDRNSIEYSHNFFVHSSYRSQLKAYSKKLFDPFCRRERIKFKFSNDIELTTTIGQLNFFRWAVKNKVIEYVKIHYKEIEEDMHDSHDKNRNKKISKSKNKYIKKKVKYEKYDIPITISFN